MTSEMSGASSLPNTPLPSTLNPFFDNISAMSTQDDDINVWSSQNSPGSQRGPTYKDMAEKMKQLTQENFQLKIRVFVCEQASGVKHSASNFAALFQQNRQQLQNALNAYYPNTTTHSTTASSASNDMLSSQLNSFKSQNELLNAKIFQLEEKISSYESSLKDKEMQSDHLLERNEILVDRLQELETEYSMTKVKMQQQINQLQSVNASTINDVDVERGAQLAFGLDVDDYIIDSENHKQYKVEMESKLADETNKVRSFEELVNRMNRKLEKHKEMVSKLQKDVEGLKNEKTELEGKIMECSKVFVDLGKRNVTLSKEVEELKLAKQDGQMFSQFNQATDSISQVRFENFRKLVMMLQGRMMEIIAFVDALFKLEAKHVFNLVGLQEDNREKLRKSLDHCRHLSHNLDELFQFSDGFSFTEERMRQVGLDVTNNDSMSYNSHLYPDRNEAGKLDSSNRQSRRVDVAVKEIQCSILSSEAASLINKLQRDLQKSETKRRELHAEQAHFRAQLESMNSNLRAAYNKMQDLEKSNQSLSCQPATALEMENKELAERLTISESALRKMHQEHANLVAKLKKLQSLQTSTSHEKLITSYMESERPSDTTSPDLGIDSGHDGAANSDDSHSINFKLENRELRKTNKELALKLRQTKQVLSSTLEKLSSTSKQKEEVEKAICRQLHKTHTILRQAKKSVEQFTTNQENFVPS